MAKQLLSSFEIIETLEDMAQELKQPLPTAVSNAVEILCDNLHIVSGVCSVQTPITDTRHISVCNALHTILTRTHNKVSLKAIELLKLSDAFELEEQIKELKCA